MNIILQSALSKLRNFAPENGKPEYRGKKMSKEEVRALINDGWLAEPDNSSILSFIREGMKDNERGTFFFEHAGKHKVK